MGSRHLLRHCQEGRWCDAYDPKDTLHVLLQDATELPARRLKRFSPIQAFYRLAELIEDFSPLRQLPAFADLEKDVQRVIRDAGWKKPH